MFLNHITLVGFLGKDPEQKKTRSSQKNFLAFSLATQESWKVDGEWQSRTDWHRVVVFGKYGEAITGIFHKGDHVLVEGTLVSNSYQREGNGNGKGKKAKAAKQQMQTFWNVRANSVRKLNRADQPANETLPSGSVEPSPTPDDSDIPF